MLRVSWLNRLQGRLLSSCRVKLGGGKQGLMSQSVAHARRPFSQHVPVEVLEVRTLLSVTNSEGGNVIPAHDLDLYFSPIAHDVGPYYAPHGKAFPGSVAPVTINDVGATSIISGGLPATVSNTPGGGSATYQISDGISSSTASATISWGEQAER